MNPYKLKDVFKYLTSNNQLLKKKLQLGTSEIPIPTKRDDVTTIEAINRFNKANPRVDTTNLKPLSVKQSNVKKSEEPDMKVEDDGFLDEALGDYNNYLGMRKARPPKKRYKEIPFKKFLGEYSKENRADGGRAGYEDGGMLVQPSDDGSRPGYMGKNVMSGSPAQQANNNKLAQERFKKIGKFFITEDYTSLKNYTRKARIATGAKDAGGQLGANDTTLLNKVVFGKDVKEQNALAKKLGINRKYMMDTWKEALEFTKSGKSKSISQNQLKKIKMQSNIFDEILSNKNATVKSMAKKFNITEKQAVKESSKLLNNVYMQNVAIGKKGAVNVDSRGYSLLKSWLPDDFKVTDNFLDNFSNIEGLKKVQSENMGTLIRDAFGKGQNPKKYAQALAGLQEYNNFVNSLPEGLKLDLDHPLSKSFLKGSGVSPDQLLNVTPISSNYNRGFKQSLSMAYDKALLADTKDIKKIKQIEKLAKDLGVNIGKGSNKKLDFGTTSIAKKTQSGLAEELVKNLNEQNISSAKLNELKKTEEGKKLLKEVFPTGRKLDIPQVEQKIIQNIQGYSKLPQCKVGAADGGRIGFAYSDECLRDGLKEQKMQAQKGNKKAAQELVQVGKAATKAGLLRNLLGPGAIFGEAVYEGAIMANKILGGTPKDIAWAESYLSYLDPRKYTPEGLDPLKMRREDMITREDFNDPDYAEGESKTIDGPNANILRSGFAAQDQLSAFNEAVKEKARGENANRFDIANRAAADVREQGKFVDQSKNIISSDAFQEATKQAQEYIRAQTGENMFPYNQFKQSIGKYESGEARDLRGKREKEMQALGGTYQDYENPFNKDEYENFARQEGYLASDKQYTDKYFTDEILNPLKFEQLMKTPGFKGASDKFASGGLANLMKKYND